MPKLQEIAKRSPKPPGGDASPEEATRQAVAAVFRDLNSIVEIMIGKAKAGSHLHAKLLFEFARISAASLAAEAGVEPQSLAQVLMEKLDRMAEESASAESKRPVE